ncbi:MAG: hypothetical protein JWP15_3755, partial [Alphaproteobacteria bacterium]|nr:hypothetical protein [Alphaproteobacteria bacterium]
MKPELRRFGESRSPVVVIDGFSGDIGAIRALAAAIAPFPADHGTNYPGLRRILTEQDDAFSYVNRTLTDAAPFIGGGFGCDSFDLLEASFSMVTARPESLLAQQRAPHFDSPDPNYLAVLHYLSDTPGTGTAFYRQRSTGIETIEPANLDRFVAHARRESAGLAGYTNGSTAAFEQIGLIEAVPDRLIVYQGR